MLLFVQSFQPIALKGSTRRGCNTNKVSHKGRAVAHIQFARKNPRMSTWNAEDYAKNSAAQFEWACSIIRRCKLHGNESVLDVGCGDGKVTLEIAQAVPNGYVLGIDSSQEFINYARKTHLSKVSNLSFEVMDASSISSDKKFDLVFSNAVLHWVPDHSRFLNGAASVLKPGGKLVTSCGGGKVAAEQIITAVTRVMKKDPWARYFESFRCPYTFHTPEEYKPWLINAGFAETNVKLVDKDMKLNGAKGFEGYFRSTWLRYTERVPHDEREKFIGETVNAFSEANPLDTRGFYHIRMPRLEVEATKL